MINLSKREPKWLGVGCGVRVKTKQLRYSRYVQLHKKFADVVKDAAAANETAKKLSGGVLDADDVPTVESLVMLQCAQDLIVDWSGLGDGEGGEAPVTPQYIALFCENMATGPAWWAMVQSPIAELVEEGEGFAAGPNGSSASAAQKSAGHVETGTTPAQQQE